jgi:intracellular septation protein A
MQRPLLVSVFIVASCGLAYELIAGALASYLLGDSVTQFSTVIGAYLFAMGIGSWLSKHVGGQGAAGALHPDRTAGRPARRPLGRALLFLLFTLHAGPFRFTLYGLVLLIGILVGLEIPLIMRILKREVAFKDLVAQVLTFDYIGALAVSLLFPLLLAPHLGLVRSALLFGLLNALVAAWALWLFRAQLGTMPVLRAQCAAVIGALAIAFGFAGQLRQPGRGQPLQRGHRPRRVQPLPAHRRHALARRDAALPQPQPAVFLARRIPLPRGAGASRAGHPARRAQGAGAGRRRRHGGARNPQVPAGRAASRWSTSIRA